MAIKNTDITNQRFGALIALHPSQRKHNPQHPKWTCKCDCGNTSDVIIYSLIKGTTSSCGCQVTRTSKTDRKISALKKVCTDYKHKAKIREIDWKLTSEEVLCLIQKNCHYCGLPPSNYVKVRNMKDTEASYSGIDRVDPNMGYQVNNCVPSCAQCNYAKLNMTDLQFINWIKRVHQFQENIHVC
jgi:5-methylcytosine-specific restriction endonuclease McrA